MTSIARAVSDITAALAERDKLRGDLEATRYLLDDALAECDQLRLRVAELSARAAHDLGAADNAAGAEHPPAGAGRTPDHPTPAIAQPARRASGQ